MNTSRGEVIETEALLDALQSGTLSDAVIDVWEHEPDINLKLLEKVIIGTLTSPDIPQTEKQTQPECHLKPYAGSSGLKPAIRLFLRNRKTK